MMQWFVCNTTLEYERIEEKALWHNLQFHHFGLILSALSGMIAVLMSLYLMWMHATHYLKPWEQRHIIRVLFMVPVYAVVSFLSYYYYQHAIYFEVLRDCYEAFAIASFFALMCHYIAPDLHTQKDYFRTLHPKPWLLPLSWFQRCCGGERGIWRTPRSGLTWFNIIWFGVFQYCFVRVFMTFVALITQVAGRYCVESLSPAFAHIWVMVIEGGCVTVAMYTLIQFYYQLRDDLSEHRPFLKIVAIKFVIFLSFWQTIVISFLTSSGAVHATPQIAIPDIKVGIPSLLLCIEMAIFSVLHLWAFPWKVYDVKRSPIVAAESGPGFFPDPKTSYKGGFMGIKAFLDAFNPWDLVKAVGRGFKWALVGRKHREKDISYKHHVQGTDLAPTGADGAFGVPRRISTSFVTAKPGRYQPLDDHEDDQLLAHAQSNPVSRAPDTYQIPPHEPNHVAGDIGAMGVAARYGEGPVHLGTRHPTPGTLQTLEQGQETGVTDTNLHEDTRYHGAHSYRPPPTEPRRGQPASNPWGGHPGNMRGYPPRHGNVF